MSQEGIGKPNGKTSDQATPSSDESEPDYQTRGRMDGTKPVTDRNSKMVMLRAERGDIVENRGVISEYKEEATIPDRLEVQRRTSTYYGTELLLEPTDNPSQEKYLITAPGPDSYLYLWVSDTDEDGFREGWSIAAEIKASFSEDIPQYSLCSKCGEPIKNLEHVRLAAIDSCPSGAD